MRKKFNFQQGYGGLGVLIGGLILAGVMYFFIYPKILPTYKQEENPQDCVFNKPSETDVITLKGASYGLIKKHAYIIKFEQDFHLIPEGDVEGIDGKILPVFSPKENISAPGQATGNYAPRDTIVTDPDTTVFDLRFREVTSTVENVQQGIGVYDVYLKMGDEIPLFIKQYCEQQKPFTPLLIFQDTQKGSFPPFSFNTKDLTNLQPGAACTEKGDCQTIPENTEYVLFSYEDSSLRNGLGGGAYPETCRSWHCPYRPMGDLMITVDGQPQRFTAEYYASAIKQIALFATDPLSPYYKKVQFNYAIKDVGVKPINEAINLNTIPKTDEKELQLKAFTPFIVQPWGWWTPECKPAVYLYPKKEMAVNVQVAIANGFLTYTDPLYPKDTGWNVLAKPTGELTYLSHNLADSKGRVNYPTNQFPYLYYEGKIKDSFATKPESGFVKSRDQLAHFFDQLLPKLGLNQKETTEFKDYWLNALPTSPYYFIGIIPIEQLNTNEPLTITPKEDTMIRVRLYFEALDAPAIAQEPSIQTPTRTGFTVVDWGGIVKRDKDHPFTCLQ